MPQTTTAPQRSSSKVAMPEGRLAQSDPDVARLIDLEVDRQRSGLELIASENFVSPAVLEAMGTPLTNKYAEGLPGKRYYGGCEFVDMVEQLAIDRVKKLFAADHANVQAHSGAQANAAVYLAFLKPGDTVLGLDLSQGGHLTHGSPVNFSGLLYHAIHYGVGEDGRIDYAQMQKIARDEKPKMIIAGASAYARIIDFEPFAEVAREIGAKFVVDMAHFAGLVATGYHPSPVPHADAVTTTTHKTLRGPRGGLILCKEEHAKAIDKAMFPGTQGGPLEHIIAAKAVAFKEALDPSFKVYCGQIVRERAGAGQCVDRARLQHRLGRNRQPPDAGRSPQQGRHRQSRRKGAGRGGNHGEQEHGAEGDPVALRHQRNPDRHSGGHHPRNEGAGDAADRPAHRHGDRQFW